GGDGRDQLDGGEANDFLYGDLGNDRLTGGLGDDRIDGGAGNDTAIYAGNYADYTVILSGSSATVTGADGSDTLTSIEFLQFDDLRLRLVLDPVDASAPASHAKPDMPVMAVVTLDDAGPHLPVLDLLAGYGGGEPAAGLAALAALIEPHHALAPPEESRTASLIRLTDDVGGAAPTAIAQQPDGFIQVLDPGLPLDQAAPDGFGFDAVEGWH
ncbi:MAG: hypothetical protein ACI82N_001515, partial [Maricaulis sp.]